MTIQASFTLRGRNPDVLTCIANLSSDEVFTPPSWQTEFIALFKLIERNVLHRPVESIGTIYWGRVTLLAAALLSTGSEVHQ